MRINDIHNLDHPAMSHQMKPVRFVEQFSNEVISSIGTKLNFHVGYVFTTKQRYDVLKRRYLEKD